MIISVVIPLYNKEKTILKAVNSVFSQTYSDIELIVVDDGSKDLSARLVEDLNDPRIKLYREPNRGVSAARNFGAEKAVGDWIAFLDADDEYDPGFLMRCVEMIRMHKNTNISFVAANYIIERPSNNSNEIAVDHVTRSGEINYFKLCKGDRSPAHSSSVVVNRKTFFKVGGFPAGIKHFEDWILWMKLAWYGKFIFIAEPLSHYFADESGVSSHKNLKPREVFKCANALIETADSAIDANIVNTQMARDSGIYINSFIVIISRFLARHEMYILSFRLLAKLKLKYLRQDTMTVIVRIFAIMARSGFRRVIKIFYSIKVNE